MMRKHLWARTSAKCRRIYVKGRWEGVKGRINVLSADGDAFKGVGEALKMLQMRKFAMEKR